MLPERFYHILSPKRYFRWSPCIKCPMQNSRKKVGWCHSRNHEQQQDCIIGISNVLKDIWNKSEHNIGKQNQRTIRNFYCCFQWLGRLFYRFKIFRRIWYTHILYVFKWFIFERKNKDSFYLFGIKKNKAYYFWLWCIWTFRDLWNCRLVETNVCFDQITMLYLLGISVSKIKFDPLF